MGVWCLGDGEKVSRRLRLNRFLACRRSCVIFCAWVRRVIVGVVGVGGGVGSSGGGLTWLASAVVVVDALVLLFVLSWVRFLNLSLRRRRS